MMIRSSSIHYHFHSSYTIVFGQRRRYTALEAATTAAGVARGPVGCYPQNWVDEKHQRISSAEITAGNSSSASRFPTLRPQPSADTFTTENNGHAGTESSCLEKSKIIRYNAARLNDLHALFLNAEKLSGIKSQSLPTFNTILKGHRRGELTIFTGPTGSGKTSILSQLSLDFCFQGVPTLWGSFEIPPYKLVYKMLHQCSPAPLFESTGGLPFDGCNRQFLNQHQFKAAAAHFANLPMYFMDFYGSTPLEEVLKVMHESVLQHNVQHIILDNLQFMLSGQEKSNFDKYDLLDHSIASVRDFATKKNVHVTLVVHPRKENDDTVLGISSVLGSSKATQEADNLIILQKIGKNRYLDIKKNRFDGDLGRIHYEYDKSTLRIKELSKDAIERLNVTQNNSFTKPPLGNYTNTGNYAKRT